MAYQDRRSFALYQLYSQIMIIILAVLNTYYPQYLSVTFIVFILISFAMSFLRLRSQIRGSSIEQIKEIRRSKKLYEEESTEILRLMALDTQLTQEMKPLAISSFLSLFAIFITLAWYYLYFNFAGNLAHDPSLTGPLRFLIFLIGYEVPYFIMFAISVRQNKAAKSFAQILRSYAIFESGLVGQGIVIKPPMDNYEIKLDSERKFVELVSKDENKPVRIRLYSSKPDELFELIRNLGS
ncbi:MAG: DUF2208 family protein [Thermoproteota archaeon]